MTAPVGEKRSYRDFRPVVMPASLDDLASSLSGIVTLPRRLNWSPNKRYDLDIREDLERMYVAVIQEASTPADFAAYLNRRTLVALWPTLHIGPHLANLWASRFPELPRRVL